jgi:TolB-like protein/tRNA A-37 threonylcarbamoyl transferase component Bud32/Tfp pilus assembly protein PilF
MGVTYKAFDEQLRIDVALKVINPPQVGHAKTQALFLREARAAARVHHSNVANVVFLNPDPANPFYAMEFVPGESMRDWLRGRVPLNPLLAIGLAEQIALGLEAIHAEGVIHRDLKPGNIMIVRSVAGRETGASEMNATTWQVKIIDFGLAREFAGDALSSNADALTTGFRGTAMYASPEQCQERTDLDGRADLYSLGCILWEMLTGAPPFRGNSLHELMSMHVSRPAPVRQLSHLPESLQAVLARLLVKEPDGRFANAAAVVKALDRCRARIVGGMEMVDDAAPATEVEVPAENEIARASPAVRERTADPAGASRSRRRLLWGALGVFMLVALLAAAAPRNRWWRESATSAAKLAPELSRKTVAVLPFENLSSRPEDAYLADGLQEEILNSLARLRDLKVISRTSVKEYRGKDLNIREIGQRLGAGTIIEGSVRRDGDKVRLTIQVIDARDDKHLLSTTYDREVGKVLELQSAVARQVADALAATLTSQERGELDRVATTSGDAYDRYLHAVAAYRWDKPGQFGRAGEQTKRLLEDALRFDPNYADAYAFLSQIQTGDAFEKADSKEGVAALQAYERALALDPQLPEAQLARGLHALYISKNLDQALSDLGHVAEVRPNSAEAQRAFGSALRRAGRAAEAVAPFSRAYELDPLNLRNAPGLGQTLLGLRRFPEASQHRASILARYPNNGTVRWIGASIESRLQRNCEPLRALWRDYRTKIDPAELPELEVEIATCEGRFLDAARILEAVPDQDPLSRGYRLGMLYHAAGERARAEENFRAAETHALELQKREPESVFLPDLAAVQSMLGQHDAALATIDREAAKVPESRDGINGPPISFLRSIILVRAGRRDEGYAEVARLLRVPFGAPINDHGPWPLMLTVKDDPKFDELIYHPPRL